MKWSECSQNLLQTTSDLLEDFPHGISSGNKTKKTGTVNLISETVVVDVEKEISIMPFILGTIYKKVGNQFFKINKLGPIWL